MPSQMLELDKLIIFKFVAFSWVENVQENILECRMIISIGIFGESSLTILLIYFRQYFNWWKFFK